MCIRFLDQDYLGAVAAAEHAEGSAFFVPAWKAAALAHLHEHETARWAILSFYGSVVHNWCGRAPATPRTVLDWFCEGFPIRLDADRERLRTGVVAAGLLHLGRT